MPGKFELSDKCSACFDFEMVERDGKFTCKYYDSKRKHCKKERFDDEK